MVEMLGNPTYEHLRQGRRDPLPSSPARGPGTQDTALLLGRPGVPGPRRTAAAPSTLVRVAADAGHGARMAAPDRSSALDLSQPARGAPRFGQRRSSSYADW